MRSYKEHALEIFKDKPKFLVSSLDDAAAAVLGASAIVGNYNIRYIVFGFYEVVRMAIRLIECETKCT